MEMRQRRTQGRQLFLAYLCCAWIAILMAAPLVSALEPASAGASRGSSFLDADANGDGYVSPAEAARVAGLSPFFSRADANADERLNRAEFYRALAYRSGRL
jgi:hypothetical protein